MMPKGTLNAAIRRASGAARTIGSRPRSRLIDRGDAGDAAEDEAKRSRPRPVGP